MIRTLQGIIGEVLRDHDGKFIAAVNEKSEFCFDAFMAEALALRFGLNFARTVECNKVEVNSDNVNVITTMHNGVSSSVASAIFDDCYFMSLKFTHIIF